MLHCWPEAQAPQVAPAAPHEAFDSDAYGSHVPADPPLQHPFGHEVASQTHWPALVLHSSPAEQALHVAPAEPHEAVDSPAKGSHVEPLQHPEQEAPPHVHTPLMHACPDPHPPHAAPPAPH